MAVVSDASVFKLPPLRRRAVPRTAMEQDQRWPSTSAVIGDAEPADLDHLHGRPFQRWPLRSKTKAAAWRRYGDTLEIR